MLTGWFHVVLDSVSASKLGVHSPPGSSELTNRRHRFGVKRLGEDPATVGARLGVHDVRRGIRWISGALGHRLIGRDRDQDLPWTHVPRPVDTHEPRAPVARSCPFAVLDGLLGPQGRPGALPRGGAVHILWPADGDAAVVSVASRRSKRAADHSQGWAKSASRASGSPD